MSRVQGDLETGATGLEPATSGVTGRRSNQLSYAPGGEPQYAKRATVRRRGPVDRPPDRRNFLVRCGFEGL